MMRKRPANLPARPQPRVIVGFDSEWVADGQLNKMLSYQMVVLNADTGKMSESYFPLDGRTNRRPKGLGWLLQKAADRAAMPARPLARHAPRAAKSAACRVRRCGRWLECANSGHSQTMRRTGQVDPKRAFKDGPPNGWKARGSGTSAEGLGTLRWFRLGPNFGSIGIGAKRAYGCRSHLSSYRGRAFGMRASGRSSGPPPHEAAPTCRKS
jgi:hypothetical protein